MSATDDRKALVPAILLGAAAGGAGALMFKASRENALMFAALGAVTGAVLHASRSKSNTYVTGGGDGGVSFEDAWAHAQQQAVIGQRSGPDPIDKISAEMNHSAASIVSTCAPETMSVVIKAAIQNGHVLGVTVSTTPKSPTVEACIASRIRRVSVTASSYMDAVTVTF